MFVRCLNLYIVDLFSFFSLYFFFVVPYILVSLVLYLLDLSI
jgi:hypothetical protein